jgi:hypothetical protein
MHSMARMGLLARLVRACSLCRKWDSTTCAGQLAIIVKSRYAVFQGLGYDETADGALERQPFGGNLKESEGFSCLVSQHQLGHRTRQLQGPKRKYRPTSVLAGHVTFPSRLA